MIDEIKTHERFMSLAIKEAEKAFHENEVPVGAVVVLSDNIIASAHNRPINLNDPTAHAEVLALREASKITGNYRIQGAWMYVTIEPCIMCVGAIIHARIEKLIFGASDAKGGAVVSLYRILEDKRLNHKVQVIPGILKDECSVLISRFFENK